MVGQPQCYLGNLRREFFNLDAIKLVNVDVNKRLYIQHLLSTGNAGAQQG